MSNIVLFGMDNKHVTATKAFVRTHAVQCLIKNDRYYPFLQVPFPNTKRHLTCIMIKLYTNMERIGSRTSLEMEDMNPFICARIYLLSLPLFFFFPVLFFLVGATVSISTTSSHTAPRRIEMEGHECETSIQARLTHTSYIQTYPLS